MIGLKVSGIPRDQSPASEYIFRTRPTNLYLCGKICTSPRRIYFPDRTCHIQRVGFCRDYLRTSASA